MYLGSKIFKGTDVFGKIIKFDKGKTEIFLGKFSFLIINNNLSKFYCSKLLNIAFQKLIAS